MRWYECPKCGRELDEDQAYHGRCKKCGDVVVKVCGKTATANLNTATVLELIRIGDFGKKTLEKVKDKVCV